VANQPSLDLRHIIDVLRKEDSDCYVRWQKVKLYDIDPWEFLSFAKQDLKEDSERGRINALSNAKRAIECRADEILTLSNLKGFSSRYRWGLPYKLRVLKTLGLPAPDVLSQYITSKRNVLEHEYARLNDPEQTRYVADIAGLFLSATDRYIEKGYISSTTISYAREQGQWQKSGRVDTRTECEDRYELTFDLEKEVLAVSYKQLELLSELYPRTAEIKSRIKAVVGEQTANMVISDCKMEDVRELMKLLRERG